MVVTQESKTCFVSLPRGLVEVAPRAAFCHVNHLNNNGISGNARTWYHLKYLHVKDGVLFTHYGLLHFSAAVLKWGLASRILCIVKFGSEESRRVLRNSFFMTLYL